MKRDATDISDDAHFCVARAPTSSPCVLRFFLHVFFNAVLAIVMQQVERVRRRLADKKIGLRLTPAASSFLCDAGFDPAFGARPVKRAVQHHLETAVAQSILKGDVSEEEIAVVDVEANDGPEGGARLVVSKEPGFTGAGGATATGARINANANAASVGV